MDIRISVKIFLNLFDQKNGTVKKWGDKEKSIKMILIHFLIYPVPFLQYIQTEEEEDLWEEQWLQAEEK